MENNASIGIKRNANIIMGEQPDYIGVSKSDWTRLKKKVDVCKNVTMWWMNIGFTSFGIAASSFLSSLTIPIASESVWIKPTIICVGVFTLLIGVVCIIAHKREGKFCESNIKEVKEVIDEIDKSFIIAKPE